MVVMLAACGSANDGDDDNDNHTPADDDSSPVDDDNTSPDGDDDDNNDDDDNDNDDDNDDDDNDDDDDDNNDTVIIDPILFADPPFLLPDGSGWIQQVDYGQPGHDRTAIVVSPEGRTTIAVTRGRQLVLYHHDLDQPTDQWDEEWITQMAGGADLALDSTGALHLAYTDLWQKGVVYATDANGAWEFETVDVLGVLEPEGPRPWYKVTLALRADGQPHLAYNDPTDPLKWNVRYARREADGWAIEILPFEGDIGDDLHLAIDAEGHAHLLFGNIHDLITVPYAFYADNTSGEWTGVFTRASSFGEGLVIDSEAHRLVTYRKINYASPAGSELFFATSRTNFLFPTRVDERYCFQAAMALDATDGPHLIYNRAQLPGASGYPCNLRHAYTDGQDWPLEVIFDYPDGCPMNPAVAIDSEGRPLVSAHSPDSELIFAQRQAAGAWESVVPVVPSTLIYYPGMTTDDDGTLHLAFRENDDKLLYITNAGGQWRVEDIRKPYNQGVSWSQIATDGFGIVHVLAVRTTAKSIDEIDYFRRDNGVWLGETLPVTEFVPYSLTVRADQEGHPHVFYEIHYTIFHVQNTSGNWVEESVVDQTTYKYGVAIDSQDRLHVSHVYGPENQPVLAYSLKDNQGWHMEIVDPVPEMPDNTALVLSSDDRPFIAYSSSWERPIRLARQNQDLTWSIEDLPGEYTAYTTANLMIARTDNDFAVVFFGINPITMIAETAQGWKTTVIEDNGLIGYFFAAGIVGESTVISYWSDGVLFVKAQTLKSLFPDRR